VIESHFKVRGCMGLGTGFPCFISVWKSVETNPANAPAENPGCTSRQTGVRESSARYLQVLYGTATHVSRTWRQMARSPRARSATRHKVDNESEGGKFDLNHLSKQPNGGPQLLQQMFTNGGNQRVRPLNCGWCSI
jgi:hypothetical protein